MSPVLCPGKDYLIPSEEAASLTMAVWLRGRRQFRTSPENSTALPAPSPVPHGPVSDALGELAFALTSLLPPSPLPPWAENKTFRVRVYCEFLLNSNHHQSAASPWSGHMPRDQVALNPWWWPCLAQLHSNTDWSTGLIHQYNQQADNCRSISFSKYTVLLMSLIQEKIKHSFIFTQQLVFFIYSHLYIKMQINACSHGVNNRISSFSRLSCFLCNTKKRMTIKIYAPIYVLFKTSAALTGSAQVKSLQLCWKGFKMIIYHAVTNISPKHSNIYYSL